MKRTITATVLVAAMLVHASAFAQEQDKDQQKCINTLNKGMAKVAGAQLKAVSKCTSDFAKNKNMDAPACYNTSTKVDGAQTKNCTAETKKCTTPPDFGSSSCNVVNGVSEYNGSRFADDLFGESDPNAGITLCAADKPGCKCQAAATKASGKLYSTRIKTYNKCKKAGLQGKTMLFTMVSQMDECLALDPKGKIGKAETKLGASITKKCNGVTTPFGAGECASLTGAALSDCIAERVLCRVCLTAQSSDGLSIDCDNLDNGSDDLSCFDDF